MRIFALLFGLLSWTFAAIPGFAQEGPIVIRAGTLIDGKGGVSRNVTIVVEGSKIKSIGPSNQRANYDFSTLSVMPGMIDTYVHLETHFGKTARRPAPAKRRRKLSCMRRRTPTRC